MYMCNSDTFDMAGQYSTIMFKYVNNHSNNKYTQPVSYVIYCFIHCCISLICTRYTISY